VSGVLGICLIHPQNGMSDTHKQMSRHDRYTQTNGLTCPHSIIKRYTGKVKQCRQTIKGKLALDRQSDKQARKLVQIINTNLKNRHTCVKISAKSRENFEISHKYTKYMLTQRHTLMLTEILSLRSILLTEITSYLCKNRAKVKGMGQHKLDIT